MMSHLILIASNPPIPETSRYFAADVYDVQVVTSAESMIAFLADHAPTVVIIDAKSMGINIEEVRRIVSPPHQAEVIPIIWLLESDAESERYGFQYPEKIDGYRPPNEDYTIIPFDTMELALRTKNAINYKGLRR